MKTIKLEIHANPRHWILDQDETSKVWYKFNDLLLIYEHHREDGGPSVITKNRKVWFNKNIRIKTEEI